MTDACLSQAEADKLIKMEKRGKDNDVWLNLRSIKIPLLSSNGREKFILDLHKSRADPSKGSYQIRVREAVVLVRLDYGCKPHRNPDESQIGSPHLHHYREGHGDKWAKPLPVVFANREDDQWLKDFMDYCNIVSLPIVQQSLFK